ncbi:MAG: T9SS type A sorting domain-containing protein [Candidatus Marinimicrobia bacterium]|nr:T9SS type A sorting domain-containing protein [Candidatus Neomarinimicrobiota bacterium]
MTGIKLYILIVSTIVLHWGFVNAQSIQISGIVTDKRDNSVRFVDVSFIRDGLVFDSTQTDEFGYYSLLIPTVGISDDISVIPKSINLKQNYPNPLNPSTIIELSVPESGTLTIYNILGQEIDRLAIPGAGSYSVKWNGVSSNGKSVSAGVYFYSLVTNTQRVSKKMVLIDGGNHGDVLSISSFNPSLSKSRYSLLDTLLFENQYITNTQLPITAESDTTVNLVVNHGPKLDATWPDPGIPIIFEGDTLTVNLNWLFYNDDQSLFGPAEFIVDDTLFQFIGTEPDTLQGVQISASDIEDTTLHAYTGPFPIIVLARPNVPPLIDIPDMFIAEDTNLVVLIDDLNLYAEDADGDTLIFRILSQSNTNLIYLVVESVSLLIDSLSLNGNGESSVAIEVSDGQDADTSIFSLTVESRLDLIGMVKIELVDEVIPIPGAVVSYAGYTDTTDSLGRYNIQLMPNIGVSRLIISHSAYYERETSVFVLSNDTTVNESMVDTSFNMAHYDQITRSVKQAEAPGTQRWTTVPTVYLNINPAENSGGGSTEVTQAMIDTALSVIKDLPLFAYQLFPGDTVEVEIGTDPPWGVEDYIICMWDNTIPGNGAHGEHLIGNRIDYAVSRMRTTAGRSTYVQELSQNLGARNDSQIVTPSIFNSPSVGSTYTPNDLLIGRFLYTRKLGNLIPDSDP